MYTLTDPEKKNYFEDALETPGKLFARRAEKQLKSDSLEGSIAAANESEMFDSDFAAYEQMAKQLRDSLPEAMKSDVQMKAWEARLAQANAYLESSKAYYTKNYAIYEQNSGAAQGSNPDELEQRGLKDGHTYEDYVAEMGVLNDRNMFTVVVDENGQFVMSGGAGINDHFDEEHFRQNLEATDIRQPETYWPKHGTVDMPGSQEDLETKIYSGIVNDSLEKINAERWYKNDRGMDPKVELNEDQREEAYRQYAKAAAEDAYRAEQQRQEDEDAANPDAFDVVLEASQGNFDTGQTGVVYQFDWNGVSEDSAQYDENYVNVNDLDAQAALEINLTNAPKSEIIEEDVLESSGNAGRTHAVDRRRNSNTRGQRIRTYNHGLQRDANPQDQMQRPVRFSVSAGDPPNTMRIYFKIQNGDPEIQHILIEKGSATWNTVADQLGRDWLDDVYEGLSGS